MTLIYDMNRTLEGWNLEENILSVMTLKDQTQGPCRSGTAKFGLLRKLVTWNAGGFPSESNRQ